MTGQPRNILRLDLGTQNLAACCVPVSVPGFNRGRGVRQISERHYIDLRDGLRK